MKQFSINHKHDEHETQQKVKSGGQEAPRLGWSLPPLSGRPGRTGYFWKRVSTRRAPRGPKRVKTEFWSEGGFIIHELWMLHFPSAPSWLVYEPSLLFKRDEENKTKSFFHALFPIIGNTIILLLAETNDSM